jgi:hypothetical protein
MHASAFLLNRSHIWPELSTAAQISAPSKHSLMPGDWSAFKTLLKIPRFYSCLDVVWTLYELYLAT